MIAAVNAIVQQEMAEGRRPRYERQVSGSVVDRPQQRREERRDVPGEMSSEVIRRFASPPDGGQAQTTPTS